MGNGAMQNNLHSKRLMHKYLGKLFSTTFNFQQINKLKSK